MSDYCKEASIVSDLVTCIVKVDRLEKSIFKACYNVAYGYCQHLLRRTISDGLWMIAAFDFVFKTSKLTGRTLMIVGCIEDVERGKNACVPMLPTRP